MGLGDAIHDFFSSGKGLVRLAADRALATGVWSALPTPSADFRGGWFRTEGGAGVEDAHYLALKNAADAPVFDEIATLAATQTFTNKTLTAPTIADFTNSQHDHGDADDGGNIPATSVTGLSAVWLETLSPSAAASSSSSAILTSTYENYLIVFNLSSQSGSVGIDLRLRAAGSDTAGTAYYWARQTRTSAAATGVEGGVGAPRLPTKQPSSVMGCGSNPVPSSWASRTSGSIAPPRSLTLSRSSPALGRSPAPSASTDSGIANG
jgi:hypothetical protein